MAKGLHRTKSAKGGTGLGDEVRDALEDTRGVVTVEAVEVARRQVSREEMRQIPALLRLLNKSDVRYLIIGATAFAAHGWVRATADLDL